VIGAGGLPGLRLFWAARYWCPTLPFIYARWVPRWYGWGNNRKLVILLVKTVVVVVIVAGYDRGGKFRIVNQIHNPLKLLGNWVQYFKLWVQDCELVRFS
jgi:hypothetical protein